MNKVKEMLSSAKDHTTSVDSKVANEVTHETVRPVETEEINRKVHEEHEQHHHQHRIQPVTDKQVLPEQHENITTEAQHHRRGDGAFSDQDQARLNAMHSGVQNEQVISETERSRVAGQTQTTGQVHHHIHETIQPVIERETIKPTVRHVTEQHVHHIQHDPVVHDSTVEKPMSIDQFQTKHGENREASATYQNRKPHVVPSDHADGSDRDRFNLPTHNDSSNTAGGQTANASRRT